MWATKTLHVQLSEKWYRIRYPYSPAMKQVLSNVFTGQEYPHCLPTDYQPKLIVDVGGNVGAAAIWFHHRYPTARIVSYEPSTRAFELLKENTQNISQIASN